MSARTDAEYIKAAKRLHESEGEVEVDANARVSRGGVSGGTTASNDPGAYVQAWVWVPDDQAAPETEERPMMLVNTWAKLIEDGMIYRLVRVTPEEVRPWTFCLECCSDYRETDGGKFDARDEIVEVCDSAFNDFDHLCAFAKEVAAILHCEPATIVRAI